MILLIVKLSIVIVFFQLVGGQGIKIWPKEPDYVIDPESEEENRTIVCNGNVPIQWYFEKFDKSLIAMLNYSMENFDHDKNRQTYYSLMVLNQPSHLDTGFYYCAPMSVSIDNVKNYKKIYIYVTDPSHLFADPGDFDLYDEVEDGQYRIPCRPTAPDVNVTLKINNIVTSHSYHPSKKIALINDIRFNDVYTCEAKRNNYTDKQNFSIPVKKFFSINHTNPGPLIAGENVTLNCFGKLRRNYKLKWIVPNIVSIQYYDKETSFNATHGHIQLTIHNVNAKHNGVYTCELNDLTVNKMYSETFTLNMITFNTTYIDLKMLVGNYRIIRPAGFKSVHWKIQISANRKVNYVWADPDNNIIETTPAKIRVDKNNTVSNNKISSYIDFSELTINDLQVLDSGIYTLIVTNETNSIVRRVEVTLLVEEKPSVVYLKSRHKDDIYYEYGKVYTFEFYTSGYPLPKGVNCHFKSCQNFPWCNDNEKQAQIIEQRTMSMSKVTLKTILKINTTVSGSLICSASNLLGNSTDQHLVFVSDVKDGFEIIAQPNIAVGDDVTFICRASKHNYVQPIKWNIEKDNETRSSVTFKDAQIENNDTDFTISSYYTVKQISYDYNNRIISCTFNRKAQSDNELENTEKKTFKIIVKNTFDAIILTENVTKDFSSDTDSQVQLKCIADGRPLPVITWFKDGKVLETSERVSLEKNIINDKIETNLIINSPGKQDVGTYKCEAKSRINTAFSYYVLIYQDEEDKFLFMYLIAVLSGLFGVGWILCYLKEKDLKTQLRKGNRIRFDHGMIKSWNPELDVLDQTDLLPYDARWEFPMDKLKIGKKLGSGAFGIVNKGYAEGITDKERVTTVAVKTVKPDVDTLMFMNALRAELKIMCHIGSHANVVNLLGACTAKLSKKLMVIVEYCRFGNIQQYLLKHRDMFINQIKSDGSIDYAIQTKSKHVSKNWSVENSSDIPDAYGSETEPDDSSIVAEEIEPEWRCNYHGDYAAVAIKPFTTHDLICWAFQVTRGMDYLASKKILHGDLAARNVLLADGNVVKICDFGLAKSMYEKEYYRKKDDQKELLPYKWMSIEAIKDRTLSTQSDIWSFGIVLWEIFSLAANPYPNIGFGELLPKLLEGYRMDMPRYANTQLYKIMKSCWHAEPKKRPLFFELADCLGDLLEDNAKSHYVSLNDYHEKLNAERSPTVDFMKLITKRRDSNSSFKVDDSKESKITSKYRDSSTSHKFEDNKNSKHSDKKHSADRNEIEMLPIVHNPGYDVYKS